MITAIAGTILVLLIIICLIPDLLDAGNDMLNAIFDTVEPLEQSEQPEQE